MAVLENVNLAGTLSELDAQIKDLFEQADAIERRYPDSEIKDAEDLAQMKALLETIDAAETRRGSLETNEQRKGRIQAGLNRYAQPAERVNHAQPGDAASQPLSPGDQFLRDSLYRQLQREGSFKSDLNRAAFAVNLRDGTSLIEWKQLLGQAQQKTILTGSGASSGGPFVFDQRIAGLQVPILQRELNLLDLVPRLQTVSDTIQYIREDTFTNSAAMTAEASATTGTSGTKPESAFAYSTQSAAVRTMAHWLPITNRLLDDAPAIRGIIDSRLLLGLNLAIETQVVTGDGTGENLTGLINAGIQIQALGTDNRLDAIFKGRTLIRLNGHARPNAVVLHPTDFQSIRLARESAATATPGSYLMGPPSDIGATTLWGLPVVESEALSQGTGLVGAFDIGCSLFDREQAALRVGTINDQFVRNMQTILAEMRAAFIVWRPTAFCRVTGL